MAYAIVDPTCKYVTHPFLISKKYILGLSPQITRSHRNTIAVYPSLYFKRSWLLFLFFPFLKLHSISISKRLDMCAVTTLGSKVPNQLFPSQKLNCNPQLTTRQKLKIKLNYKCYEVSNGLHH